LKKVLIAGTVIIIVTIIILDHFIKNNVFRISFDNEWSIGIFSGTHPLKISDTFVSNPVIQAKDVTDINASFVADPFLIRTDSLWYVFFEVLDMHSGKGKIAYAYSNNGKNWTYGKMILNEPFHVSYPHIIYYNDTYYMIPESAEKGELRLYQAIEFPDIWKFKEKIIDGNFGDHALLYKDSLWWLFAGAAPRKNDILRLFFSKELNGQWIEHPQSPIVFNDARKARPGGPLLSYNQKIYRIAQDCKKTYGKAVNAFEIDSLTKSVYKEKPFTNNPVLSASKNGWARHGMHQLSTVANGDGEWVAAVDGYKRRIMIQWEF
jgi:hypothetical protein